MKKIIILLNIIGCMIIGVAVADTINVNWMVGNTVYDTTTCTIGGDLNVPITAPTKRGHIFRGWDFLYTALEYIESNGGQIINTEYYSESNFLRVVGRAAYTTSAGNALFGNFNGTEVSITLYHPNDYVYVETGRTLSGNAVSVATPYVGATFDFDITAANGQRSGTFNGVNISGPYNGPLCTSLPLCVFGSTNTSGYYLFAGARIHFFKIYSSSGIVRDFVPVRRNSDGAIGMYDKVTNTFFGNSGTGTFIAGPEL